MTDPAPSLDAAAAHAAADWRACVLSGEIRSSSTLCDEATAVVAAPQPSRFSVLTVALIAIGCTLIGLLIGLVLATR